MPLPRSARVVLGIAVAAQLALGSSLFGIEPKVKKLDTSFPAKEYKTTGSGSGVIVGPRLVLTNRHVAMHGDDDPAAGFKVLLGPGYKQEVKARAAWVCENYDLALLETASDLSTEPLSLLDEPPPLGLKVTAFGFPLGDEFGISLTATGGQITRLPVDDDPSDAVSTSEIKRALWHDAMTAGGSSGGPLFDEHGILVGLHCGSLVEAKGQGIAVPPDAIAEFLRHSLAGSIKFVNEKQRLAARSKAPPKICSVFIHILDDRSERPGPRLNSAEVAKLKAAMLTAVKDAVQFLNEDELSMLAEGKLYVAYYPLKGRYFKEGQIVRIQDTLEIIQIMDDGFLCETDGVRCRLFVPHFNGSEARAKLSTKATVGQEIDNLFVVGKPTDYVTVAGAKGSYFPLTSVVTKQFFEREEIDGILALEKERRTAAERADTERRRKEGERKAEDTRRAKEREAQAATEREAQARKAIADDLNNAKTALRKKINGIDAIAVGIDGTAQQIVLIRMSNQKLFRVDLDSLSVDDRRWVTKNIKLIKRYGDAIKVEFLPKDPQ